jgi:hypothetical protein
LRKLAVRGVLLALALIVVATVLEFPLLRSLGGGGPGLMDFVAINGFTSAIVLIVAAIVRLNGYSLARSVTIDANAAPG